ncbi:MAG: hypothetical protein JNM39_15025 [Bdellovibrionaceae bacterium]|nr:hypothetical protein [Pseudobdellovibrionaceae bacterium]
MDLFSKGDSYAVKEAGKQKMLSEIDRLTEEQVMKTKLEDWADHFADKFVADHVTLDEAGIYTEINDVQVDPRTLGDRNSFFYDDRFGGPRSIAATEITFRVPFSGDSDLLYIKPSSYSYGASSIASLENNELVFRYTFGTPDAQAAKAKFDRDLGTLRQNINNLRNDFTPFNSELKGLALSRLQQRFSKLQKDNDVAAALGFPVKKRGDAPKTYAVPSVKRKITPRPQPSTQAASKPEPTLMMDDYEHILTVTKNMVTVIEQSPHVFKGMDEESLRTHFLVQLNGQYEGQATGETFNFEGKTDIIIKDNGKNIFIGECKFWKGAVGFTDTITQLLGYLSWRDTKAAILLFNRNKDLSNVLAQIPGLVKAHPNYVRDWKVSGHETEFRYILHHRDDKNRELFLTVQVYEVPT